MSKKIKVELNLAGVNELMKRQELQDMMQNLGEQVASRAEAMAVDPKAEYESNTKTLNWIAVTNIRAVNHEAFEENLENNTLSKALYGG
jgi:hypothetical protein